MTEWKCGHCKYFVLHSEPTNGECRLFFKYRNGFEYTCANFDLSDLFIKKNTMYATIFPKEKTE